MISVSPEVPIKAAPWILGLWKVQMMLSKGWEAWALSDSAVS